MAEPKRNPLNFGLGDRSSFVQRFILAEVLGPPKGRRVITPPVMPPPPPPRTGTKR